MLSEAPCQPVQPRLPSTLKQFMQRLVTGSPGYVFLITWCPPNQDGFDAAGKWHASGSGSKGGISSLADAVLLPNFRIRCMAARSVSDLTPLADLQKLERVELKHNRIANISVPGRIPTLLSVGINDIPVTDLSVLS